MQEQVLAYVVRSGASGPQLLVFQHAKDSAAGVQVPAGTVEKGETIETALWRELHEEAGLQPPFVTLDRKLAEALATDWDQVRHVYLLQGGLGLPNEWHRVVGGDGEDRGMVFKFYWVDLRPRPRLAGGQDHWLSQVVASAAEGPRR